MKCAVIIAGCLAIVLMGGCGGQSADEAAAERVAETMIREAARQSGADVDVDISSEGITVRETGPDGERVRVEFDGESGRIVSEDGTAVFTAGAAAEIPEDFPKDVPLYENMTLMAVQHDPALTVVNLTASSDDSPDAIAEFYKEQTAEHGWTQDADMSQPGGMHMLIYSKGDRNLQLVLVGKDGKSHIQLNAEKE